MLMVFAWRTNGYCDLPRHLLSLQSMVLAHHNLIYSRLFAIYAGMKAEGKHCSLTSLVFQIIYACWTGVSPTPQIHLK